PPTPEYARTVTVPGSSSSTSHRSVKCPLGSRPSRTSLLTQIDGGTLPPLYAVKLPAPTWKPVSTGSVTTAYGVQHPAGSALMSTSITFVGSVTSTWPSGTLASRAGK